MDVKVSFSVYEWKTNSPNVFDQIAQAVEKFLEGSTTSTVEITLARPDPNAPMMQHIDISDKMQAQIKDMMQHVDRRLEP